LAGVTWPQIAVQERQWCPDDRVEGVSLDIYASEEQQVEALRKWWRENWIALVLGVSLGLGGLFGYRFWQDRVTSHAEVAAELYSGVLAALNSNNLAQIETTRKKLQGDYADTPYAPLAALVEAKARVASGELAAANLLLEWVVANAEQPEVIDVARLRLARLLLASDQADAALAALDALQGEGFKALIEETRGDAHRQRGETDLAAQAYQRALDAGADNSLVLRMKLDDLGIAPAEEK